ncbi:MAG TPA: GTP-binding protein [Steroidobacteraceae bacterium]|nr:GTP-binding protein [Steroidobacteraceae bacterium]
MNAVPVNIICGALGSGKTTAIANLLATKPADESWVVILNEFTDTGLDALTLASAAIGSYDVRMIPGGCLCCTGEEDFRRQLSSLLTQDELPSRILIEPSGVGYAGAIVEELRPFEHCAAIKLCSTIALIESRHITELDRLSLTERDQVDASDVVIMSKAELSGDATKSRFKDWAQGLFPAKRFVGFSERGMLPALALSPPDRANHFSFARPANEQIHVHALKIESREVVMNHLSITSSVHHYLNREACGWIIPAEMMFDLEKVRTGLSGNDQLIDKVERLKCALRTGVDRWHLMQRWRDQFEMREISWRNDSRMEVQMQEDASPDWSQWDEWIASAIVDD